MAALVVGISALVGGFYAADQVSAASTTTGAYIVQSTTVTKVVTIRRNGKTIIKRYPVVHTVRIKARSVTVKDSRTITTPGGVKTVPITRIRYVPVTHTVDRVVTNVVRLQGKTRTVVTTTPVTVQQTVATTLSQTQTQVVTNEHTTTNMVTNEHTNTVVTTAPARTVTTRSTTTVVTTHETTQTLPPVTTTQTLVATQTVTTTKTVTNPPVTSVVTVTVTTSASPPQ